MDYFSDFTSTILVPENPGLFEVARAALEAGFATINEIRKGFGLGTGNDAITIEGECEIVDGEMLLEHES